MRRSEVHTHTHTLPCVHAHVHNTHTTASRASAAHYGAPAHTYTPSRIYAPHSAYSSMYLAGGRTMSFSLNWHVGSSGSGDSQFKRPVAGTLIVGNARFQVHCRYTIGTLRTSPPHGKGMRALEGAVERVCERARDPYLC